jgi:superfamily II DNA helicase RecQ
MVRRKLRKYKAGKIVVYGKMVVYGKIIVYGNSVPKVKALAKKLGYQAYNHHAIGKESMLEAFMAGRQHIIVAISALGKGVDVPDVRVSSTSTGHPTCWITHRRVAAGRDGLPSEAIMIVQEDDQRAAKDK